MDDYDGPIYHGVEVDDNFEGAIYHVKLVGGGGSGDQHNLGWYATQADLEEAHPTATAGDWAIVGSTDTVWIWDTDNEEWTDSGAKSPTYTAGTGISITNNEISATDPVLVNKSNKPENNNLVLQPRYENTVNNSNNVFIMSVAGDGWWLRNGSSNNTFIGAGSSSVTNTIITNSIAIGYHAKSVSNAIQLGIGNNDTPNTFKVSLGANNNYELMSADGTVPHARLTNAVQSTTVTIATADWSSNTVSVTVSGLTATSVVWVAPDNASQSTYTTAGVYASSQSADTLVFNCVTTPTSALTINIVWC